MKWIAPDAIANDYFSICNEVIHSNDFGMFKRDTRYNNIVGMSTHQQLIYWIDLYRNDLDVNKNLNSIKKNDISMPPGMTNTDFGFISPSTMRYVNTSKEIMKYLGPFENIDVLEIGVGYGGLAYVLSHFIEMNTYKSVDLDFVQKLADIYLKNLGFSKHTPHHDGISDLLISEFCFSEFDDGYMNSLFESYFTKTKNFYLVMNLHDSYRKNYWKDKLSELFTVVEYQENPTTQWPNYVWCGTKNK